MHLLISIGLSIAAGIGMLIFISALGGNSSKRQMIYMPDLVRKKTDKPEHFRASSGGSGGQTGKNHSSKPKAVASGGRS